MFLIDRLESVLSQTRRDPSASKCVGEQPLKHWSSPQLMRLCRTASMDGDHVVAIGQGARQLFIKSVTVRWSAH
jgi:hypothetical protein